MAGAVVAVLRAVIVFVILGYAHSSISRKVITTPWPGCDKDTKCRTAKATGRLPHILYSKASTPSFDTLHYVFSTKELPTILIARTTGHDTDLTFDWELLLSNDTSSFGGLAFTNQDKIHVDYKFGFCFTKLIEYDDDGDDADLVDWENSKNNRSNIRSFGDFTWQPLDLTDIKTNKITFNTTDDDVSPNISNNGSLSFSFEVPSEDGRVSALPSQKYIANETVFEFLMDKFTPTLKNSRFALETVAVSLEPNKKMDVTTIKTIDDEYSPGVFLLTNWLTNPSDNSKSGFAQWKPVSYFGPKRGRKTVTKVKNYDLFDLSEDDDATLNATLLSALFGHQLFDSVTTDVKKMNISFGQSKDGYYLKKNYTVWNGAIGYGTPPKDEISLTVIIIISTGLGIPVLICIIGGIYTISKAVRKKSSQYQAIGGGQVNHDRPQVN